MPEEIYRKAKVCAAEEGISLKALIIKALTEYIDRREGKQNG
jgi:predicted HicB family RNase H-like nuclease